MLFENHNWSENVPEAISEDLKFKHFLGGMPPDSPRGRAVTCSPFLPPPQIFSKYYFALPPPLIHFSE